jgi:hypothetical protein
MRRVQSGKPSLLPECWLIAIVVKLMQRPIVARRAPV